MARSLTRRAIEWPRMLVGLWLVVLGWLFFTRFDGGQIGPALSLFGLVLAGTACLGRGCNRCGKVMHYREFGLAPRRAGEVAAMVRERDVERVIALLQGPRIGDLERPRTALMISCCTGCGEVAELTAGELGPGFRTLAECVVDGDAARHLALVVRATPKDKRR